MGVTKKAKVEKLEYTADGIVLDLNQKIVTLRGEVCMIPKEGKRRTKLNEKSAEILKEAVNKFDNTTDEELQLDMLQFIKSYQEPFIAKEPLTGELAITICLDALPSIKGHQFRLGWEICQKLQNGGKQVFSKEQIALLRQGLENVPVKLFRNEIKFNLAGYLDPLDVMK